MSLAYQDFYGGGLAKSLDGETHQLIPQERWNLFSTANAVVLKLPNALGLPFGFVFHVAFQASAGTTTVENYNADANQTIFDINGVSRTSIDHTTPNWSTNAAIEARLIDNTSIDGIWTLYSWGSAI